MIRTFIVVLLGGFVLVPFPASSQTPGDIVISEIMEDPAQVGDTEGEYIEVFNATNDEIDMMGWTIRDGNGSHTFASSVVVPGDGFAVLCREEDETLNGGVQCEAAYTGPILANSGRTLVLEDDSDTEIDRVEYDDASWPTASGASMEFIGQAEDDNNDPVNWQEAPQRLGDFAGTSGDYGSPNANASGGKLPVELVAFRVALEGSKAVLTWQTASETNNAGFSIQHRSGTDEAWDELGFVEGEGTTHQPQSYRYETGALDSGVHTFRLEQTDLDGSTSLGPPRTVAVVPHAELTLAGPNPLSRGETASLTVTVEVPQAVEVALYNVLGQRVHTLVSERATPERPLRATLSAANLSSGMYFLRAVGSSLGATRSLVITR